MRYADALARLLFAKPLQDLSPTQRAELDVLRALDGDKADEERYEQLASDLQDEPEATRSITGAAMPMVIEA